MKAYGSTIEEARADLFGLYYVADPKLVELGLSPSADAYKAQYYTYLMNGLMTQLVRIEPGNNVEEAHMRNRQKGEDKMSELLKMEHLVKYYGNKTSLTKALNDISLTVEQGEFTAIMGASGSGKTTLLNCISTIDRPTGGKVWIDGVCTSELKKGELADFRRNRLGFIFQEFNLLDTLTAFDNIALALQIQKCPHDKIKEKIEAVAQKLGIREVLEKYPYQLSGGQKQRVAAARAIITHPSLILADEPTGALDSKSSKDLLESLKLLNETEHTAILMVTHDAYTASYARRVIFIKDGKVFHELLKGTEERRSFFEQIMDVISLLGGDMNYAD